LSEALLDELRHFGLSSTCNLLSAIKTAKKLELGRDDVIVTVATDGAEMYASEVPKAITKHFAGTFDRDAAARSFSEHLGDLLPEHTLELSSVDRDRIFNLGYFTWVEQQGVSLGDFEARRSQEFWRGLRELLPAWDRMIGELNSELRAGP
jgi:hypothetical protein